MAFGKNKNKNEKDQEKKVPDVPVENKSEPEESKPVSLGLVPDDILLAEVIRRELGLYAPTDDKPAAKVEKDKLYKAGTYSCRAGRGFNTGAKVYDYGDTLVLQNDTFLKDLPYLKHFAPYKGTPQPSLTPYGAKFNTKVPKSGESRGANFKNHPGLKGQGTAGD